MKREGLKVYYTEEDYPGPYRPAPDAEYISEEMARAWWTRGKLSGEDSFEAAWAEWRAR